MKNRIVLLLFFLIGLQSSLYSYINKYSVNIRANNYGIDPQHFHATYDDVAKRVIFTSTDSMNPGTIIIPNVYKRKLISDPPGINFIGTIPNPHINPGFITDSTSYREINELYSSKY